MQYEAVAVQPKKPASTERKPRIDPNAVAAWREKLDELQRLIELQPKADE